MSVEFSTVRDRREAALEANWEAIQRLQAEHDEALREAFRRLFPRRKWNPDKAHLIPGLQELRVPFVERAKALHEARDQMERDFEERLKAAAKDAPLPKTESLNLVYTASSWSYHTQGFGASRYARAAALREAAEAIANGLRAEVREVGEATYSKDGVSYQDYGVWANTDAVGYEILQHKPSPPLRDVLKTLMRAGTNPRVFYPFLPWGMEESLGLDAFGNDVPGWSEAPSTEAHRLNAAGATALAAS